MEKYIIVIDSEYQTDGEKIGENIAKKLNIKFYNNQLLNLISKESGINKEVCQIIKNNQKLPKFLYYLSRSFYFNDKNIIGQFPTLEDKIFIAQNKVIKNLSKSPCVILGHCANEILKEKFNCLNIFIYANKSYKLQKIKDKNKKISDKNANRLIKSSENIERNLHSYYYEENWEYKHKYDILLNRSKLTLNQIEEIIIKYISLK